MRLAEMWISRNLKYLNFCLHQPPLLIGEAIWIILFFFFFFFAEFVKNDSLLRCVTCLEKLFMEGWVTQILFIVVVITFHYLFFYFLNFVLCLSDCCKRDVWNSARSDHCQSCVLDVFSSSQREAQGAVFDDCVNTLCVLHVGALLLGEILRRLQSS